MNSKENEIIISLLKKHGAIKIGIFGSYARGEERPDSDIDILVEFSETKGLLEFIGIGFELEDILGKKIDLFTEENLRPIIKANVMEDLVVIYEERK
ncbi:MAG: nucleotidyltransferase family protein [Candidatus Methanofastidiosum sp.]|nr:nucleotidyltransferase family protein [Methanofastidiosum sp.]